MSLLPALAGWILAAAAAAGLIVGRRAVDQHLARARHELSGPLTAVRLGLSLGAGHNGLTGARLRAIDAELERAAVALDDLAVLRPRALLPAALDLIDVGEAVAASVTAWEPVAAAAGVAVEFERSGEQGTSWVAPARLAQAVGNLLANAIRHGASRVRVTVRAQDGSVRVEVADDGPGLPAPVGDLVRRGRRARGTHGHGLAVAARVAEAHDGALTTAPSPHGATLVIALPRGDAVVRRA